MIEATIWSRSYQTLIFPVFRFSMLSLRVCSISKNVCAVQQPSLVTKTEKIFVSKEKKFGRIDSWKNMYTRDRFLVVDSLKFVNWIKQIYNFKIN